jgi:hypothetical protein
MSKGEPRYQHEKSLKRRSHSFPDHIYEEVSAIADSNNRLGQRSTSFPTVDIPVYEEVSAIADVNEVSLVQNDLKNVQKKNAPAIPPRSDSIVGNVAFKPREAIAKLLKDMDIPVWKELALGGDKKFSIARSLDLNAMSPKTDHSSKITGRPIHNILDSSQKSDELRR